VKREKTQRPENDEYDGQCVEHLIEPQFESVVQRATVVPDGLN
jgi:hypothetical protein